MKKTRFKKHEDVSLYRIVKLFLNNLKDDEITDRANGVAFNFILAIFPAIIFLFTLIPYVTAYFPSINRDSIMGFFRDDLMMPERMYEAVSTTILDIVSNQRGGLLTLGFFLRHVSLHQRYDGSHACLQRLLQDGGEPEGMENEDHRHAAYPQHDLRAFPGHPAAHHRSVCA